MANTNYILKIKDQSISIPLSEPLELRGWKEFDSKLPLVINDYRMDNEC